MNIEDIRRSLFNLKERDIPFFSEADFQHQLAWDFRKCLGNIEVHLEVPFLSYKEKKKNDISLDILVIDGSRKIGIELKYKTSIFEFMHQGRHYALKQHAAQNINRYDIYKDIERLQNLIHRGDIDDGYVIVLTNDNYLLKPEAERANTQGANFYLRNHEKGDVLAWNEGSKNKNMKLREDPIRLLYDVRIDPVDWHDYKTGKNSLFKCMIIQCSGVE